MEAVVKWLDKVQPRAVSWIWPGWIPRHKISILGGEFGVGKSYLSMHIAARITQGEGLPGVASTPQGNVLLLAAEDGLEDTILPRLIEEGADTSKVCALIGFKGPVGVESPDLSAHYTRLAALCQEVRPELLIVDPINNYVGSQMDSNNNVHVRSVIQPLVDMAGAYKITMLFIHHFNKNRNLDLRQRLAGSNAYGENVRSAFGVLPSNPEDVRRVVPIKWNLCTRPAELRYEILDGRIRWLNTARYAWQQSGGEPSAEVPSDVPDARHPLFQGTQERSSSWQKPTPQMASLGEWS